MKSPIQNDLAQKFSKGTIASHWVTAVLILVLFPLGKYMEELDPSEKMELITLHAILGIIVFGLTILRTWLFFKAPRPNNIQTGSKLNDKLVIWVHNLFYFLLFGLAISGIATMIAGGYVDALDTGNSNLIKDHGEITPIGPHGIMAMLMMLLLIMHIIGVIKHYISTKENTLKRII